jgi:hypothetical protein
LFLLLAVAGEVPEKVLVMVPMAVVEEEGVQ